MVLTFDSSTSAVQAYELMRTSAYEEKKLLGMSKQLLAICSPNCVQIWKGRDRKTVF